MRCLTGLLLLLAGGCSTAPLADVLDFACPPQMPPPIAQCPKPLASDVAVVGVAEDLLHLLDSRIKFLPKDVREGISEDLHRVAELFAKDTNLVEMFVVVEVLAGGPVELAQQVA